MCIRVKKKKRVGSPHLLSRAPYWFLGQRSYDSAFGGSMKYSEEERGGTCQQCWQVLVTKAPSQGVSTNCFRKEQAVTGLPRSARGWQTKEVRSGCSSEQMGLPDSDSPSGRDDNGGGMLSWGPPVGQFKAHFTSK